MHFFGHLKTVNHHRRLVRRFCFKCGLIKQGLTHDLSKYSRVEFLNGAKYYTGNHSPIRDERIDKGYSEAWLHHKGRNKHHHEYWMDFNLEDRSYGPIEMPERYIAESFCDRLAATMTYHGKEFKPIMVKEYAVNKDRCPFHQTSKAKLMFLIDLYLEKGEKEVFSYIKKNMRGKGKKV